MAIKLIPYFTFDGKTAEAMKFYQSIFGGELDMQTFGDAKMADTEELKNRIIHASLTADQFSLMASDSHPEHGHLLTVGNGVNLSFVGTDAKKLTEYFNKLAEGGAIEMPLEKQFWGDVYGACEDKFGVHWMVNISAT